MIRDLSVARTRKEEDNAKVSPVELLKMVLADIEDGETNPDGMIIICMNRPEEQDWTADDYRCGMTNADELAFLRLAEDRCIRRWRNK